MHIVQLEEDTTRADGQILEAGQYIVDDLNAAELLVVAARGTASLRKFDDIHVRALQMGGRFELPTLIIHPGGYGDQMMLGPALRAFKRLHPKQEIHVCCREKHRVVFEGLGYPDKFIDYPLRYRDVKDKYWMIVLTENMNELGESAKTKHSSDIKAELLGVDLDGDVAVEYKVTQEEEHFALSKFPRLFYNGAIEKVVRPRVGIQLAASAPNRTPHPNLMANVIHSLYTEEWEIIILGTPGSTAGLFDRVAPDELKAIRERVHDAAALGLTFRQSAAVVEQCDVILAPDSAIMHLAGALEVPCVALFGPIDYKLRTAYYPSVHALQGKEGCPIAPCFFHQRGGIFWPENGPCKASRHCNALDSIKPTEIGRRLTQMRRPC